MKIDIVTLHTVDNYGSVMQTYATQKIFHNLGYDTEVIDYWRTNNLPQYRAAELVKNNIRPRLPHPLQNSALFETMLKTVFCWKFEHIQSPMKRFLLQNVQLTAKKYLSFDELRKNPPVADIYVTGSDQVWNSIWNGGINPAYFLDFAPVGKPRIAFSASIGRTEMDKKEFTITQKYLKKYTAISVREESAIKLLKKMGIDAYLILDPTLMLSGDAWKKIASYKRKPTQPYLLIYQLNPNQNMDEYAVKLAQLKKWKVLRVGFGLSSRSKCGKCIMLPSIPELLNLFINAKCVLTDSFHATAFSLNLGRDFISVPPPQFSTRLESILQLTHTEDRMLKSYDDLSLIDRKIDKGKVKKVLDEKRAEGMIWLKNALSKGEKTHCE